MSLTVVEPAFDVLASALKQKQLVYMEENRDGSLKVKPLGIFSRVWHWNDTQFHSDRISKLASVTAKVIAIQPRLSIPEAADNSHLKAARNLLKEAKYYRVKSKDLQSLQKEVTAAKLGISAEVLDLNPGLQHFTETHHLERYLLIFNDALKIDSSQKISIRKDKEYQPWEKVYEASLSCPQPVHSPNLPWVYGQDGIQCKDMYDWTELKPFMKGNPADWNHQFVFEFCACHNPNSIKNGVHSWFRLKTPSGDIYSIGLYRPDKRDWTDNLKAPLRIKPGYLMQPDVSEFWDFEITAIDFAITEEVFLQIKQTVEEDKKNEDLVFQLFNNNCLLYNKKMARMGGVDLPTLDNVMFFITPNHVAQTVSRFMQQLPSFVQKICLYVSAFFINIAQLFLGGASIDSELNEKQRKKAVPHINSIFDLFDVNKIYLNHPNTLGFKTRQHVLDWRKQEMDALNQNEMDAEIREEKAKTILLSLPPSYYCEA